MLGVPVKPTIKEVDGDRMVVKTLKRAALWEVQTPQASAASLTLKGQDGCCSGVAVPLAAAGSGMPHLGSLSRLPRPSCSRSCLSCLPCLSPAPTVQVIKPPLLQAGFELVQREKLEVSCLLMLDCLAFSYQPSCPACNRSSACGARSLEVGCLSCSFSCSACGQPSSTLCGPHVGLRPAFCRPAADCITHSFHVPLL